MSKPIRISLFGGPGSGKSTTAAWLFSELKRLGKPIELVGEYVKAWSYMNRPVKKWDQIYLWAKQMQYEYRFLEAGKNIVTDSPVMLASIYADIYYPNLGLGHKLDEITEQYNSDYSSLNIFLRRKDKPYDVSGRYQNYEQAKEVDYVIECWLLCTPNTFYFDYDDRNGILNQVLEYV